MNKANWFFATLYVAGLFCASALLLVCVGTERWWLAAANLVSVGLALHGLLRETRALP
jgi:hypothetical protein